MHWKSFQLNLINFLDKKNCKRLFILCFCMSALILGFHNSPKNQEAFSSKADIKDIIESKAHTKEDITNNPTSTSLKK